MNALRKSYDYMIYVMRELLGLESRLQDYRNIYLNFI